MPNSQAATVQLPDDTVVPVSAEALSEAMRPFLRADFAMHPLEVAIAVLARLEVERRGERRP